MVSQWPGVGVGTGKTYTMLGSESEPGLMVGVLNDLFVAITSPNVPQHISYSTSVSYVEVRSRSSKKNSFQDSLAEDCDY